MAMSNSAIFRFWKGWGSAATLMSAPLPEPTCIWCSMSLTVWAPSHRINTQKYFNKTNKLVSCVSTRPNTAQQDQTGNLPQSLWYSWGFEWLMTNMDITEYESGTLTCRPNYNCVCCNIAHKYNAWATNGATLFSHWSTETNLLLFFNVGVKNDEWLLHDFFQCWLWKKERDTSEASLLFGMCDRWLSPPTGLVYMC